MVDVNHRKRTHGHVARLGVLRLAKRTQRISRLVAAGFTDGVDRGLSNIRRRDLGTGQLGQVAKLRTQPLPRSREAKRGHLHLAVFAVDEFGNAGPVHVGAQIARPRCVAQCGQRPSLPFLGEVTSRELIVELLQLGLRPGAANDLDPRTVFRDGFTLQKHTQHFAGLGGVNRLKRELQLFLVAVGGPLSFANHVEPRFLDFVHAEPGAVLQVIVGRFFEHAQGRLHHVVGLGFFVRNRPKSGQSHARVFIRDALGQAGRSIIKLRLPLV